MRKLALGALSLSTLLALCGCDARKSYWVRSDPPGAEVIVDGKPVGTTPTPVLLNTNREEHVIVLRRPGYTAVEQRVLTKPVLEGPTQNCSALACSPCCLFVPLALCWERDFSPKTIDAKLERDGQGLEVVCRPVGAQIWIDGVLVAQTEAAREETIEGNARVRYPTDYGVATVPLEPKVAKVEIRADGYLSSESMIRINPREYLHLKIDLQPRTPAKP